MGLCLQYCSCLEGTLDRKYAEIINEITRIDSDVYCKYCSSRNHKKGIVVEDPNGECLKTCFECQAKVKIHTTDNSVYFNSIVDGQAVINSISPKKSKHLIKSPIRKKTHDRKLSHVNASVIFENGEEDEESPPHNAKLNRSFCMNYENDLSG